MPQIDVNGTSIYYEMSGLEQGPVLVFSNSLSTNLHMWDDQAAALAGRYRILRYDSRGHGRSGAPDGAYTLDLLANDLVQLLDALGIERFDYCGLSKGGMIGQWLGVNLGSRVKRLVLCNTSSFLPPVDLWEGRIKAVTDGGMESIVDTVIERWFTPEFIAADPDGVDRVRSMLLTTPPQGYAGCCAAIRDMDQRETIGAISVPTLVIAGDRDPATPPEHGALIADTIPGARLHVVKDAAHLSNIEQEGDFTAALSGFLAEGEGA